MRILSFFFSAMVILAVLAAVGGLVGREVFLIKASWQVRDAVRSMREVANKGMSYTQECQARGALSLSEAGVGSIQLRFTSDTEYVVEVLCTDFSFDPIEISSGELPWRVKKVAGSPGIIWGDARSGVVLEFFGRQRSVVVEDREIVVASGAQSELGVGPKTSCGGYGYQCCTPEMNAGTGEQLSQVLDCPRTCYQQCQARPVVLTFGTQPFMDPATRILSIAPGESVEFMYVGSGTSKPTETVATIDFGDGQVATESGLNGKVNHTFACARTECEYQV